MTQELSGQLKKLLEDHYYGDSENSEALYNTYQAELDNNKSVEQLSPTLKNILLCYAAKEGDIATCLLLLKAEVDNKDKALKNAIEGNHSEIIQAFLNNGAKINASNYLAFNMAIKKCPIEIVHVLLNSINEPIEKHLYFNSIQLALQDNQDDVVILLLPKYISLLDNDEDRKKFIKGILSTCIQKGLEKSVEKIIEDYKNLIDPLSGQLAFREAIENKKTNIIKLFLNKGICNHGFLDEALNLIAEEKQEPKQSYPYVKVLLQQGANIRISTTYSFINLMKYTQRIACHELCDQRNLYINGLAQAYCNTLFLQHCKDSWKGETESQRWIRKTAYRINKVTFNKTVQNIRQQGFNKLMQDSCLGYSKDTKQHIKSLKKAYYYNPLFRHNGFFGGLRTSVEQKQFKKKIKELEKKEKQQRTFPNSSYTVG